ALARKAKPRRAGPSWAKNANPPSPQPTERPRAPPEQLPPPPKTQAQPPAGPAQAQPPAPADGQWVYTEQYGWVWMPYGSEYVVEPTTAGAQPYEYVYYPTYGWTWLRRPWGWGWGLAPYLCHPGPRRFHCVPPGLFPASW